MHSSDSEGSNKLYFEGGDGGIGSNSNNNQNGHGANPEFEDPGAAAAQPRRPKKEARKIPRYESASIDEEEF